MGTVMWAELARGLANLGGHVRADGAVVISLAGHGLRPLADRRSPPPGLPPRPFGLAAGAFVVPADFDAPLPADVIDAFEGR